MDVLSREEVAAVVDGRGAARRVPVLLHFWVHADRFGAREPAVRRLLAGYPEDAQIISLRLPEVYQAPAGAPQYRWMYCDDPYAGSELPLDERAALRDWGQLEAMLRDFPDPRYSGLIPAPPLAGGRYRVAHWFFCLFERHWQLRGMTNALTDYYTHPAEVHRLFRAITDFYLVAIERSRRELGADAILTSDDLGHQTGTFFSPAIFEEFFAPYYRELVARTHELGMHFWLHACGNIELFLPALIELGVDVIHPIQKHAMDGQRIVAKYGGRICFWAGFDVQQVIPWGTPDEVRHEVRRLMDTYYRPDGRFLFTAGNGINGDCPLASLEALFEEAFAYGAQVATNTRRMA